MGDSVTAIMAICFFGTVAVTVVAITVVWLKRMELRRQPLPVAALTEALARIESSVEGITLEVERIAEAQRFSARLLAEREPVLVKSPIKALEGRATTPHQAGRG